jgi:hypothetical protein
LLPTERSEWKRASPVRGAAEMERSGKERATAATLGFVHGAIFIGLPAPLGFARGTVPGVRSRGSIGFDGRPRRVRHDVTELINCRLRRIFFELKELYEH